MGLAVYALPPFPAAWDQGASGAPLVPTPIISVKLKLHVGILRSLSAAVWVPEPQQEERVCMVHFKSRTCSALSAKWTSYVGVNQRLINSVSP